MKPIQPVTKKQKRKIRKPTDDQIERVLQLWPRLTTVAISTAVNLSRGTVRKIVQASKLREVVKPKPKSTKYFDIDKVKIF